MRIIGGALKGRKLASPPGRDTRPTTDRVRENLFNILAHRIEFQGARVMDLFAGSGMLGIEALSRGAEFCLFIEEANKACGVIRENLETTGMAVNSKVFRRDARKLGNRGDFPAFQIVFADPPYGKAYGEKAARSLVQGGWLSDNAIFILEEQTDYMPEKLNGFRSLDIRVYGGTSIGLFEMTPETSI